MELIVGCSGAQTTLFGSIGTIGIFAVFEVETNLVKALFRYKIIILTEIATVDDGIDELSRIRFEITTALYATKTLEAQRVPDAARSDISLIYKVEYGVGIALCRLDWNMKKF